MTAKMSHPLLAGTFLAIWGLLHIANAAPSSAEPVELGHHVEPVNNVITWKFDNEIVTEGEVQLEPFVKFDGSLTSIGSAVRTGFDKWNTALGGKLRFVYQGESGAASDPQLTVKILPESDPYWPIHPDPNKIFSGGTKPTACTKPGGVWNCTKYRIALNQGEIKINSANSGNITTVAHEIGHAIGLDEADPNDTPGNCPEVMNYGCTDGVINAKEVAAVLNVYGLGSNQQLDVPTTPHLPKL